jgi:type VI secretion system Hcp family effector
MAVNALMQIDGGKAPGECRQEGFTNWIEIQSWDWEVESETSWTKGGGASVGKPNPGKMNWEHYFDKSSTVLLKFIFSGASFDEIILRMYKGTGSSKANTDETNFFQMTMNGAFITKVANSATEEGNVLQKVEMVFKSVEFVYRAQNDGTKPGQKAGMLGAKNTIFWDIPGGKVIG